MKLLAVGLARSIWLFPIADWNPRGRAMHPLFFWLIEQYKFLKYPSLNEIDWQKGIKFEDGTFKTNAGEELTVTLTVYPDGVIADTRSSTLDSDEFLDKTLNAVTENFQYAPYETVLRKKLYSSELYVNMEQPLSGINHELPQFMARLSSPSNDNVSFRMGINFTSDPTNPGAPLIFRLEPAAGSHFSENRYYSHAPFQTDAHIHLLEEFESTFLSHPY